MLRSSSEHLNSRHIPTMKNGASSTSADNFTRVIFRDYAHAWDATPTCSSEAAASARPGESSVQATRTESDGGEDRGLIGRGVHEREGERERTGVYATVVGIGSLSGRRTGIFLFCVYAYANDRDNEEKRRQKERERERQRERARQTVASEIRQSTNADSSSTK